MVAARRNQSATGAGGLSSVPDTGFANDNANSVQPVPDDDADEWLRDALEVNEVPMTEMLRWKSEARPDTRKNHNGFGRSSCFARKAQMKKRQVRIGNVLQLQSNSLSIFERSVGRNGGISSADSIFSTQTIRGCCGE